MIAIRTSLRAPKHCRDCVAWMVAHQDKRLAQGLGKRPVAKLVAACLAEVPQKAQKRKVNRISKAGLRTAYFRYAPTAEAGLPLLDGRSGVMPDA